MPRCLAMAAGPIVVVRRLISAPLMLARRPLYLPSLLALAMPSRWRSSMISRSQVATPARMVSISLLVGLRGSRRSPPMERITRPTFRFDRSASTASSSAVLRARRSGLVTIKHVTLPQKGQALGQATALGDAGNLLGEHLLNARDFE